VLERYRDLLKKGAILVDDADNSDRVRALFYLEHGLQDARTNADGKRRLISRQLQFVELDSAGLVSSAGYAPYLDYRPITDEEKAFVVDQLEADWLTGDLEPKILAYAAEHIVPQHLTEVKTRAEKWVTKTVAAVKDRLQKEINYWDHRANELKTQELAGKPNAKLNSGKARQRADELESRLRQRLRELELEKQISAALPIVIGGCLVVPKGLLEWSAGGDVGTVATFARGTKASEQLATERVMAWERAAGRVPKDISSEKRGYDIESVDPASGRLMFIEVKGRSKDATTVTVTKNEILTGLNKPDEFILAIVLIEGEKTDDPIYLRRPFRREPDFAVTSVNYSILELVSGAQG
jgi:Holliday junction resolvase-like predicted endonuclease